MSFKCFLPVKPIAKGRPRMARNGHVFTPQKTRIAEEEIQVLLRRLYKSLPLADPLEVEIFFSMPRPKVCKRQYPTTKPDLDNLQKLVLDAGNGILWNDDSQICGLMTGKGYANSPDQVGIHLEMRTHFTGGADDSFE